MNHKATIKSQYPISSKTIVETKEVLDCDPPIYSRIIKIDKIKNTSSRKVYKEYISGVYHKSIFYY